MRLDGTPNGEILNAARDYGYCEEHITQAIESIIESHAVIVYNDSQGFITSDVCTYSTDFELAWAQIEFDYMTPGDEDAFITDIPMGYSVSFDGKSRTLTDWMYACKVLKRAMDEANYWPNVWHISDHGNETLLVWDEPRQEFVEAKRPA